MHASGAEVLFTMEHLCFVVTRQLEMSTIRCAPVCLAATATFATPYAS